MVESEKANAAVRFIDERKDIHTMKIKSIASIALCGALACGAASALTGCNTNDEATDTANTEATNTQLNQEPVEETSAGTVTGVEEGDQYAQGIHHAVIEVEGYDPITIELNADSAPITVSNFAKLVNNGYYNGLTFYRFQDGFCMQGGTLGNTASGNDTSIPTILGEFSTNNQSNPMADNFQRGTVAMARTMDPDSASSTFFVTLDSNEAVAASLNGQYAAFGTIDEPGMVVIDKIVADHAANGDDMMGMVADEANQARITSIKMVD